MKRHTKIYMDYFGYGPEDFIPCEITGRRANDIHHIWPRGMGGNPKGDKDVIENLMALTREKHNEYGDVPELVPMLQKIHLKFMEVNGRNKYKLKTKDKDFR